MTKLVIAAVLFFSCFVGDFRGNTEASTLEQRATWLWNPWMIVNDEAGTLAFLESKGVNKVYVQIDCNIAPYVYQSFIEKATAKGMRIYALDGGADWVAPKGYESLNQLMSWLKRYQKQSSSLQQFSGVHLDVEPYLYSGWTNNQSTTIKTYQALLLKAKNRATALRLPLEADIPFWFDEISFKNTYGNGPLAKWVIAQTDGVTIMAYRDSASMIIDIVKKEIMFAKQYQKTVVIGVETGQTDEGGTISFFEEGF